MLMKVEAPLGRQSCQALLLIGRRGLVDEYRVIANHDRPWAVAVEVIPATDTAATVTSLARRLSRDP
jgi:hypothetical protein